uniref:Uncharacterized protein n=1 Tax=Avena sativa TaxID=4498 RepID=A0ACD5Y9C6_AVESA
MATRPLLRSFRFRRPPPPAAHPASSSHVGTDLQHHLLRHSQPPPPLLRGVLANIRCFGRTSQSSSSSSKAAWPGRRVLANMFSSPLVSASAGLLSDHLSNQESSPKEPHDHDHENRVCTQALVALNILVHVVDLATQRKLVAWGAKVNHLVREGQIWRMATAALLHADIPHLTCNIRALEEFGPMLEGYIGPRRFLAIYCTSALSGSLFSYWFTPGSSVGASGAICGLIGAQAVYSWRHRETLEKADETVAGIAFLVVSNLVIALFTKNRTDHWGHLGGFLGGAAMEFFLGPDGKQRVATGGVVVLEDKPPAWFSH